MSTAFLFPGQASQYVGMGKDLYESSQTARFFYNRAQQQLPFDFLKTCFEGPEEELKQTRITQPAIFVHSVVVSQLLKAAKVRFDAVAGHSVGEYSALVAAGALNFHEALEVVALRGELMQNAGDERPGTMAAIIGMELDKVEEICQSASGDGQVVVPANMNAPGQIVVSGDTEAVKKAMELAETAGARRVIQLVVSGAFHSPLMAPAAETLGEKLKQIDMRPPSAPIYMNVTGKPVNNQFDIRELLLKQLTHPVRWEETIKNMVSDGFNRLVEVGPGKVLQGLGKRIAKEVDLSGVDTFVDVEAYVL